MFALKGLVWFIKYTRWTRNVVLAQLRLYLFISLTLDIDCGETPRCNYSSTKKKNLIVIHINQEATTEKPNQSY